MNDFFVFNKIIENINEIILSFCLEKANLNYGIYDPIDKVSQSTMSKFPPPFIENHSR